MKRVILSAALVCLAGLGAYAQKRLPYRDASLPVEQRVGDLLSRMTLEEKVGQLRCTLAWNYYEIKGNKVVPSAEFVKDLTEGHIGMLWATYRADPWTRKSLANGLTPTLAAKACQASVTIEAGAAWAGKRSWRMIIQMAKTASITAT